MLKIQVKYCNFSDYFILIFYFCIGFRKTSVIVNLLIIYFGVMINSRILYFCLVLSRMFRVNVISICDDYVHGNCPRTIMSEIASLAINEGYTVEFLPMESNYSYASFTVSFC